MPFWNIFRSEMPSIIAKLKAIREDINDTKSNLSKLMEMENSTSMVDVATIADSFHVSLWAKDLQGKFLFVNKACCEIILKCTLPEALRMTNGDFKDDALSQVCAQSDQLVLDSRKTMRFIEFAVYAEGDVYLDVVKNPLYRNGELIGTSGNAVIITDRIPDKIKKQIRKSNSIEIPVNTTMSPEMFIRFLERRQTDRTATGGYPKEEKVK